MTTHASRDDDAGLSSLSFRTAERPRPAPSTMRPAAYLEFVVDGRPLREAFDLKPADQVTVLTLDDAGLRGESGRTLLGLADPDIPPDRVALYVCAECGDLGCGAITARLTVGPDRVVWDRFLWERLPEIEWDRTEYGSVGPFVFDRSTYETTIRSVMPAGVDGSTSGGSDQDVSSSDDPPAGTDA